jgi:glycosyltransferase involved in cell wall biosynthesis
LIYIDVTHVRQYLAHGWTVTGIQRVTWEVVRALRDLTSGAQVRLLRYNRKLDSVQIAPPGLFDEMLGARGERDMLTEIEKVGGNRWRDARLKRGDILLLTEGLGDHKRYHAYERLKAAHALRVFQIIYDVIPLARPEFCIQPVIKGFRNVIPLALGLADELICISEFSKTDLLRVCGHMIAKTKPIHVWRLAHEFPVSDEACGALPAIVRRPFVVFSGTIEDRKNQHRAVRAWRKLARKHKGAMPQLVLVGGWGKISLANLRTRMIAHLESRKARNIVVLNGLNDETLRALYRNCLFTIYISSYEGWGLPIGESLWCQKPVLATTRTSLPEVGGSLADYCDPDDEADVMAAIERLAFDDAHRESRVRAIRNASLRDWKTASELLLQLMNVDASEGVDA